MAKKSKAAAFRAVREVCGPEICPSVQAAEKIGADMTNVSATAHQMRHALVALLLMHTDKNTTTCPNCEVRLPGHNDRCSVRRMLDMTGTAEVKICEGAASAGVPDALASTKRAGR